MKKFTFLILIFVFALSFVPASAAPADRFADLAAYFPADAPMFFAVRTDEAYFDKLDGLVTLVADKFPGMLPPGLSISMLYDAPLGSVEQGLTFREDIRPWLGDSLAVGLTASFSEMMSMRQPPLVAAVAITDRAAAEALFDKLFGENDVMEKSTVNDFTVYSPTPDYDFVEVAVAISNSVLFYSTSTDALPLSRPEASLVDSESFQASVSLLPEDDYDMLVYINTPAITNATLSMANSFRNDDNAFMLNTLEALYATVGAESLGFTLLDGRALVMDVGLVQGDNSALEDLGLTMTYPSAPISTDFAAHIPADAPLVAQGTNLGPAILSGLQNFRALGDWIQQQGVLGKLMEMNRAPRQSIELANSFNLKHLLTFAELSFSGMTGLNLENDVLGWMDGNFATYLRLLPSEVLPLTPDMVFLVEATDAGAAQNVIDKLASAMDQYELAYERQDDGTLAFTSPLRMIVPPEQRGPFIAARELDILLGANDSVLAMGTRPGVEYALSAEDGGLASDPTYIAAQKYFLPETETLAYMNLYPLFPIIEGLAQQMRSRDLPLAIPFISLLESASITATTSESGMTSRFVLTITDKPLVGMQALEERMNPPQPSPTPMLPTPTAVPSPTARP